MIFFKLNQTPAPTEEKQGVLHLSGDLGFSIIPSYFLLHVPWNPGHLEGGHLGRGPRMPQIILR